jgi:hypothetical protein
MGKTSLDKFRVSNFTSRKKMTNTVWPLIKKDWKSLKEDAQSLTILNLTPDDST